MKKTKLNIQLNAYKYCSTQTFIDIKKDSQLNAIRCHLLVVPCLGRPLSPWAGVDVSGRLDTLRLVLILLDWFTAKLVPRSDHTVCLTGGAMSMMLIELPVLLISSRVCVSSWSEEGLLASVFLAEKIKATKKTIKIYLNVSILSTLTLFNYRDSKLFIIFKIYLCMDYMYLIGSIYTLMSYLNKHYS